MSQLLGYFYSIPIALLFVLVLWVVRARGEPARSKRAEQRECEEKRKQRERKA